MTVYLYRYLDVGWNAGLCHKARIGMSAEMICAVYKADLQNVALSKSAVRVLRCTKVLRNKPILFKNGRKLCNVYRWLFFQCAYYALPIQLLKS